MKTLFLTRHAKSSWDDTALPDKDRPLNDRGRRDAPKMGKRLTKRDVKPDLIVSSPARRALTTAEIIATEIEDMNLPNPVIRSHYGNGFIKQYVRDHLILRTESASNNVKDYGVNKAVENLPVLRETLSAINDNYLNVQQDILETFVDRGQLRKLAEPTITSTGKRIPGLKLDHPRQLALMHAPVRFAHFAAGHTLTTAEIH